MTAPVLEDDRALPRDHDRALPRDHDRALPRDHDRALPRDDDGDMPLERVPPVNREVPPLRPPRRRPPVVAAALAVVGALVAGVVAATAPAPPLLWVLAEGSLEAAGEVVPADAAAPVDTELVAGSDGAVLRAQGARLEVGPDTPFELRGAGGPAAQVVALGEGGTLVADVEVTLSVDATLATVTGFGGAFRVERDATPRVATYDAAVGIAGDTAVSMTRLSQVPLGGPQAAVGPIILDPDDPWDQRHAEMPLETDAQLADLAAGLRATYGSAPQLAAFYQDFVGVTEGLVEALPQLAPTDQGARFGPPAETLIAAAAVTALVEGTGRPLQEVLAEVVVARAAGGTWGVVLAREDIDAAYLRDVTDEALRRRAAQGEDAEPVLPPEPAPAEAEPEPEPEPEPSPDPSPDPSPTPSPSPSPDPSPSPSPEPGPLEDPGGTIEDPVGTIEDLLDRDSSLLDRTEPGGLLEEATGSLLGPLVGGFAVLARIGVLR